MVQAKTCLDGIVDVLEEISAETIPKDVADKAKECLADFVGIFIKGTKKETARSLEWALRADLYSDPESMALWLGSTARMLDIDDGHRFAMAHPGVVVNSTAIAMALKLGNVSGKKLIQAITRGYEIYCYQGRVINPSAYLKRGVDATSVCGAAAAAAVAATLMDFNRKQTADAVSLAASLAGGLNQSAIDGSAQKYLVAGWGAKLGISAAYLARYGLGGPARVFEGKLGFCNAFSPEPDLEYLYQPKLIWDIKAVYIKRYSCVRRIHATLDAICDVVKAQGLKAADIQAIDVYGSQFLYDAGGYDPQDMAQAQTSVPYAAAILMNYGAVEDHLMEENLGNEEIAEYSKKITVIKDAQIIALAERDKSLWGAAKVVIHTKEGSCYEKQQTVPYGDPELSLPPGVVSDKFMKHVETVVGEKQAARYWQQLMSIENADNSEWLFQEILENLSLQET